MWHILAFICQISYFLCQKFFTEIHWFYLKTYIPRLYLNNFMNFRTIVSHILWINCSQFSFVRNICRKNSVYIHHKFFQFTSNKRIIKNLLISYLLKFWWKHVVLNFVLYWRVRCPFNRPSILHYKCLLLRVRQSVRQYTLNTLNGRDRMALQLPWMGEDVCTFP